MIFFRHWSTKLYIFPVVTIILAIIMSSKVAIPCSSEDPHPHLNLVLPCVFTVLYQGRRLIYLLYPKEYDTLWTDSSIWQNLVVSK